MKNRIKVLRAEQNITQAELANRVEVFKIARLFNLKIEDIFQDEE